MIGNRDKASMTEADCCLANQNLACSNHGRTNYAPNKKSSFLDQENYECPILEGSSKEIGSSTIRQSCEEQPKSRRRSRKRNSPNGYPGKPRQELNARCFPLETAQRTVSEPKRRRYPRTKYRTTAVQAAFKSLEKPREEHKKVMSIIYPPLFAKESEFVLKGDKDFELFTDGRVMMWDPVRNRKVAGAASPLKKNLDEYLRKKSFMQVFYGQDSLLQRDRRPEIGDFGWNDSRNEIVVEHDDGISMCKLVRRS